MTGYEKLQRALAYVFDVAYFNFPEESDEAKEMIQFAERALFNDWQEDNTGQIVIYTSVQD